MLNLQDIWKTFEGKPLLRGVSLELGAEETVSLLGPSGSGKSTLLRIAAGLEQPERGCVLWDRRDITRTPTHRRGFGLMFQEYALFPHLDVERNVAFGLRMRAMPRDRIRREVREMLARVDLAGFERRRVAELSGGEQQRVALARALAPRPRFLMLDEPLGALDRALREELIGELRRLLRQLAIPSLYVTHDQEEAFGVADRAAILHAGRIVQVGTPEEIVDRPASVWVARFLGLGNIMRGRVKSASPLIVETIAGDFPAEGAKPDPRKGEEIWLLLRHGGGSLHRALKDSPNAFRGLVVECIRRGDVYRIRLKGNAPEEVECSSASPLPLGEEWYWVPATGLWLEGEGEE
jgi:ABC-type Fe3+/spermidine/putrescine transport system ATPase subunit